MFVKKAKGAGKTEIPRPALNAKGVELILSEFEYDRFQIRN